MEPSVGEQHASGGEESIGGGDVKRGGCRTMRREGIGPITAHADPRARCCVSLCASGGLCVRQAAAQRWAAGVHCSSESWYGT
eukprot:2159476-Prymnesium_polylepis.1